MSTLIVTGSPREGMYSDRIGDILCSISGGKLVHLREKKIGPCHACEYCKEINIGECIQRDDMTPIYKDIRECNTIAIFYNDADGVIQVTEQPVIPHNTNP